MEDVLYDGLLLVLSVTNLCFSVATAILFFYLFIHLYKTRFKWLYFLTGMDCLLLCKAYFNFVFTSTMSHFVLIIAIMLLLSVLFINGILLYIYSKDAVDVECEQIMAEVKENIYDATGNSS